MFNLNTSSQTEYEIKVKYGILYIDTTDIELPKKYQQMLNIVTKAEERMSQQELILKNKKLEKEKHDEQLVEIMIDFVNAVYEAINALFGEGSTDKIFRVKSLSAIQEFIQGVTEVFEEIGVDSQSYYERIAEENKFEPTERQDDKVKELS